MITNVILLSVLVASSLASRSPQNHLDHFGLTPEPLTIIHDLPLPPGPHSGFTPVTLGHSMCKTAEHKPLESGLIMPEPHRTTDLLPGLTGGELATLERRRSAQQESCLGMDISASLDAELPLSIYGLTGDLGRGRFPDSRLCDTRQLLPSSPTLSYPMTNSHANMSLLEQGRALTTLPGRTSSFPLSPHGMLSTVGQSTLAPSSYLASSPVISRSFIYPNLYANPPVSQYQPNMYLQTNEGRTIELLGSQTGDASRGRSALTPPVTQSTGSLHTTDDKSKAHLPVIHHMPPAPSRDPSSLEPHDNDPSSVWRPY